MRLTPRRDIPKLRPKVELSEEGYTRSVDFGSDSKNERNLRAFLMEKLMKQVFKRIGSKRPTMIAYDISIEWEVTGERKDRLIIRTKHKVTATITERWQDGKK